MTRPTMPSGAVSLGPVTRPPSTTVPRSPSAVPPPETVTDRPETVTDSMTDDSLLAAGPSLGTHPAAATVTAHAPAAHTKTKFHAISFHHVHHARTSDREPGTLAYIKHAIFPTQLLPDQTVAQHHEAVKAAGGGGAGGERGTVEQYMAEKVQTRTTSRIITKDRKMLAMERERRRQVMATGFNSSTREAYKPLGDPILHVEDLVSTALNVQVNKPKTAHRRHATHPNGRPGANQPLTVREKSALVPVETLCQDGFEKLRERVTLSKSRLQMVKFGIHITRTMEDPRKIAERERELFQLQKDKVTGTYLDWTPDKIDREKMGYYLRQLNNATHHGDGADGDGDLVRVGSAGTAATPVTPTTPTTAPTAATASHGLDDSGGAGALERDPKHMTPDELEQALSVQRAPIPNPETTLQSMRTGFNKERHRLAVALAEELDRGERQRQSVIIQKYKAFEVGVNGICSTDLDHMRTNATVQRVQERTRILRAHPWYNDLIRVVFSNGLKKQLSPSEHLLLGRVRALIGDGVPLDKLEFIRLMKLVPAHEFMKDEVQKILKFLRHQMGISELDYLDAIESSGQMITTAAAGAAAGAGAGTAGDGGVGRGAAGATAGATAPVGTGPGTGGGGGGGGGGLLGTGSTLPLPRSPSSRARSASNVNGNGSTSASPSVPATEQQSLVNLVVP
ncbi:hypothetical protein AMAG_14983 [Allomyces macrogynus ATCC 38327]|uniref:Uncharacterized protein n=1 Tax=Allomyces macrogynus (strain ATCC 38327) TaxID=578462 RepID=A0A0L0T8I8_ALLM3|nr:hypothetical protein AMAG_14983 [Allomyces macrogynus ATCC 38327]|eukprot:KNE70884.1 hypothetical protein AMAG_14983 [Allomyces macrogynus ATCC 38327]